MSDHHVTLTHFAHRFFSIQEKFAHSSKNPGYATAKVPYTFYETIDSFVGAAKVAYTFYENIDSFVEH